MGPRRAQRIILFRKRRDAPTQKFTKSEIFAGNREISTAPKRNIPRGDYRRFTREEYSLLLRQLNGYLFDRRSDIVSRMDRLIYRLCFVVVEFSRSVGYCGNLRFAC